MWAGRDIRISIGGTKMERKVWGRKRGNPIKIVSWELGVSTDTSLQVRGHRMRKRDGHQQAPSFCSLLTHTALHQSLYPAVSKVLLHRTLQLPCALLIPHEYLSCLDFSLPTIFVCVCVCIPRKIFLDKTYIFLYFLQNCLQFQHELDFPASELQSLRL